MECSPSSSQSVLSAASHAKGNRHLASANPAQAGQAAGTVGATLCRRAALYRRAQRGTAAKVTRSQGPSGVSQRCLRICVHSRDALISSTPAHGTRYKIQAVLVGRHSPLGAGLWRKIGEARQSARRAARARRRRVGTRAQEEWPGLQRRHLHCVRRCRMSQGLLLRRVDCQTNLSVGSLLHRDGQLQLRRARAGWQMHLYRTRRRRLRALLRLSLVATADSRASAPK